eukprot:CAMPEP_0177620896 /NCGR_PEP_ID=MMETSP0419_2-20121207/27226_1 /TAXON_ID=582737 /ORGANISM="Tetraselmis sp., Strain GSL018" /LENGTH=42 /DNA_ID= /DNA_START= /DNA_END= /DNA_ORIENTATION=
MPQVRERGGGKGRRGDKQTQRAADLIAGQRGAFGRGGQQPPS